MSGTVCDATSNVYAATVVEGCAISGMEVCDVEAFCHGATGGVLISRVGAVLMWVLPLPHTFSNLPLGHTLIDLLLPSRFLALPW